MAISNKLQESRRLVCFVKEETTSGTPEFPSNSDAVKLSGYPTFGQSGNYIDLNIIRDSRTKQGKIFNKMEYGTFSNLVISSFPSGSAGTAPMEAALMKGILGTSTNDPGVSEKYHPAVNLPTYSIWLMTSSGSSTTEERTLWCLAGCVFNACSIQINNSQELQYVFGGDFARLYYAGTEVTGGDIANTATSITISSANYDADELFFPNMQVKVIVQSGTATTPDTALTVSAVSTTALTVPAITVGGTGDILSGNAYIVPFLPTPSYSGNVVELRDAQLYFTSANTAYGSAFSGSSTKIMSATIDINQNIMKPLADELDGTDYPSITFIPDTREITGTIEIALRTTDQGYFEDIRETEEKTIGIKLGTAAGAGNLVKFYIPEAFLEIPSVSMNNEGANRLTFNWTAVEPSDGAEEEFEVYYE